VDRHPKSLYPSVNDDSRRRRRLAVERSEAHRGRLLAPFDDGIDFDGHAEGKIRHPDR
jgi:hypothetical protein